MEDNMNEYLFFLFPIIFIGLYAVSMFMKFRYPIMNLLGLRTKGIMSGADLQARINHILDKEKQRELFHTLRPVLNTAELYRRKQVKIFYILAATMAVTITLYTIYAVPAMLMSQSEDSADGVFVGYFIQAAIPFIPIYLYKKHFKKHVTPLVAETIHYKYDSCGGGTWSKLAEKEGNASFGGRGSNLFGSYNTVKKEDNFSGDYHGKSISFEEIKVIRGSGKNKSVTFKGLLMAVDAPKNAEVPVVLKRDRGDGLVRFFGGGVSGMEKITLEDPQFEKEFDVYSTDQIKARTILTPRFMERLKGISEFYGGAPVMAAFYDEKVFIAVKLGQDLFEPASFFTDARSKRNIELILAQIELQHQVVESLE